MGSERTISDSPRPRPTHYNSVPKLSCYTINNYWLQWSMKTVQVIVFLLSLMRHGSGYEAGAPVEACRSLSPDHNPYPPQDPSVSPSPYVAEISASKSEGHQQDFSIRLSGSYFTGFLLQVHNDQGSVTTGQFVSSSTGSQFMTCHTMNDSVTHTNGRLKREMEFTWRASGVLGVKNYLKGTIVKTMNIFWINVTFEFPRTAQGADNTRNAVPQHDMNHKHDDL